MLYRNVDIVLGMELRVQVELRAEVEVEVKVAIIPVDLTKIHRLLRTRRVVMLSLMGKMEKNNSIKAANGTL
jgi:hypothetical protein